MPEVFDHLVRLDLQRLSERLAVGSPESVDLYPMQWLGVVELLTMQITECCADASAESWTVYSRAYSYSLDSAVSSGSFDHYEAVVRRLNLSAALLQRVPASSDVDLLDPNRILDLFLSEIQMSPEEARVLSFEWQGRNISDIRRLRSARSLVWPTLLAFRTVLRDDLDPRLKEWESVFPLLP